MTDLADQSFTYTITSTNLTAYHNNDLDPFAYVTTSRYTSNKFYRVMIDIGALKRLIVGYR
jgi:predicted ribosome-associated RNA-binding protein Tma20